MYIELRVVKLATLCFLFIARLNKFNEVAKTPIEEWMAFLKEGVIRKGTTTPGLKEAEEKLRVGNMIDN